MMSESRESSLETGCFFVGKNVDKLDVYKRQILMLNQAPGDREILAKKLGSSARQLSYVKQSGAGEGLLLYGDTILPFVDRFPQNTELYLSLIHI